MSNPSTLTISGASCQTRWLKEPHAVSYKACCHVPLFVDNFPAAKNHSQLCRNNSNAKKRGIGKKLVLTIRAVVLDEKVDLVAGDFNGAAWRRDNSNGISIIEEACLVLSWSGSG